MWNEWLNVRPLLTVHFSTALSWIVWLIVPSSNETPSNVNGVPGPLSVMRSVSALGSAERCRVMHVAWACFSAFVVYAFSSGSLLSLSWGSAVALALGVTAERRMSMIISGHLRI